MANEEILIEFNKAKYDRFKVAFADATIANKLSFIFDGKTYLTGYAKYLLEYMEPKFRDMK